MSREHNRTIYISMGNDDPVILVFVVLAGIGKVFLFPCLIVWFNRQKKRREFNFYITDFWAVVIGLLPTYCMIGLSTRANAKEFRETAFTTITLFVCQMIGMTCGWFLSFPKADEPLPRRFDQFMIIAGGAFAGAIATAIIYPLACLNCLVLIVMLPFLAELLLGRRPKP